MILSVYCPLRRLVAAIHGADAHTVDRGLTAQLLEHLGGSGKSVTRLADRDVEHQLLDLKLAHGVARLVLAGRHDILAIGLLLRGLSLGLQ